MLLSRSMVLHYGHEKKKLKHRKKETKSESEKEPYAVKIVQKLEITKLDTARMALRLKRAETWHVWVKMARPSSAHIGVMNSITQPPSPPPPPFGAVGKYIYRYMLRWNNKMALESPLRCGWSKSNQNNTIEMLVYDASGLHNDACNIIANISAIKSSTEQLWFQSLLLFFRCLSLTLPQSLSHSLTLSLSRSLLLSTFFPFVSYSK